MKLLLSFSGVMVFGFIFTVAVTKGWTGLYIVSGVMVMLFWALHILNTVDYSGKRR